MQLPFPDDLAQFVPGLSAGDRTVLDAWLPLVYEELRRLARRFLKRERPDHSLQTTGLVHEAYLRLAEQKSLTWESKSHLLGIVAKLMRWILVDHARKRNASKGRGRRQRMPLLDHTLPQDNIMDFEGLNEALTRLSEIDPQQGQVVELRFFGGLTIEETAESLGISTATVKRDWRIAKAWLHRELKADDL
jgi:RNA polymerase sigma factor (TIGR02999 family)